MRSLAVFLAIACGVSAQDHEHDDHEFIELHGSGTTNPSKYFWKIMDLFEEQAHQNVRLTYRAVGSSTGQKEFAGADNGGVAFTNFGAGDIPMTQERYDSVVASGRTMVHIPFVIGAVAIFHSVPTARFSGELDLDGCLLARIFTRNITTWDHPDILAANPSLDVPAGQNIEVVHRTLGSSSTSGVTEYLSDVCPEFWTLDTGSTIDWPADTNAAQGSGGMSTFIASNEYAIGYIDAGHGHDLGLSEISLRNKNGNFLTSKEADIGAAATEALAAGILPADATASFADVNLYDQAGDKTWPITLMSYMYLNQNLTEYDQAGQLLMAFVGYVLSEEGQAMAASEFSFVPVPVEIQEYNNATIMSMALAADTTPYIFESAETTQVGVGAGEFVISGKRRSYGEVERDLLQKQIDAVVSRIGAVESSATVTTLHGSGTTNPSKLFWKAMLQFEDRALLPLHLTYRAVGSSTGQKEFLGADNGNMSFTDFGAGDIPITSERYSQFTSAGRTVVHVPFVLGAIGIFHSVPASNLSGQPLDLDSCLLARIFDGDITTWDHEDIKAKNPSLDVPADQPIIIVHRNLGSSSTAGTTQYLEKSCPSEWTRGSGSTIEWPAGAQPQEGSGGVSSYLKATPYAISYLDSGHGHSENLAEISLQNADGNFLTTKQADISKAGAEALKLNIIPSDPTADWSEVNLYDLPGSDTWPITLFSYFYVNQDLRSLNQTGQVLKAMIQYILDEPSLVEEFRFAAVPKEIYDYNMQTLGDLMLAPDTTPMMFENETMVGTGAGSFVISEKRRSYLDVEHDQMMDTMMMLQMQVNELTTQVNTLNSGNQEGTATTATCSCDDYDDSQLRAVAGASMALAIVALIIALVCACKMVTSGGSSGKKDGANIQHQPSISEHSMGDRKEGMQKV